MIVPRFYAIVDHLSLATRRCSVRSLAEGLRAAGVTFVQLRDKSGIAEQTLSKASMLRAVFKGAECLLVMNDRPDLALLAGFDGVHVGQDDLAPEDARSIVRAEKIVGISTHSNEQVLCADSGPADYVAIGPVFSTSTKSDAAAVVGLEGVRRARALTSKPLVAIGGITRGNARSVIDAGADSLAVISELLAPGETPEKVARDFLDLLR